MDAWMKKKLIKIPHGMPVYNTEVFLIGKVLSIVFSLKCSSFRLLFYNLLIAFIPS